ncbi:MAG: cell division protein ZipA [Gammaproteobacteria bacterium]|nr:cell division protein ZipA [Gammaproteobacteria bacterium]
MDYLRPILILGGIALVVGIYLWERLRARRRSEPERWQDIEMEQQEGYLDPLMSSDNPFAEGWHGATMQAQRDHATADEQLDELKGIVALDSDAIVEEAKGENPADQAHKEDVPQAPREEVIILSLMAGEGESFNGMQLLDAMELCGLRHGEMGIFHYQDLDSGRPLFSVANVLEPGSFNREQLDTLETPGLALFMRLPAPIDGEKALLTFVQQAKRLKEQLGGVLTDGQRRELSRETLDELKNTARRFRVFAD